MRRFLFILPILLISSCAGREIQARLDDIESYIEERPDSALAAIRSIDTLSLRSRAVRAHYSLLHAMALDKNYIDTTDLRIIGPAVKWYRRHGGVEKRAKSLYYQAVARSNAHDYAAAYVVCSELLSMLSETEDMRFHGLAYSLLSHIYRQTYDNAEEVKYRKKAHSVFQDYGTASQKESSACELAMAYANAGNFEVSDSVYRSILGNPNFSARWRNRAKGDYAYMLSTSGMDDGKAYGLYRSLFSDEDAEYTLVQGMNYAYLLALNGRCEEAESLIRNYEAYDQMRGKYWRARICMAEEHYEEACMCLSTSMSQMDSSIRETLSQSIYKAQNDNYLAKQENQRLRKLFLVSLSIIIALCAVILIIMLLMIIVRNRRKSELERQNLTSLSEAIKRQLNEAQERLEDEHNTLQRQREELRAEYIMRNRQLLSKISDMTGYMFQISRNHSKEKYNKAYRHINDMLKDIAKVENQKTFENSLNERMDNVMADFREDFPDLKEMDYRCVSYSFAGFDTTMTLFLTGIESKGALYTRRSRLRKMIEDSQKPRKNLYLNLL